MDKKGSETEEPSTVTTTGSMTSTFGCLRQPRLRLPVGVRQEKRRRGEGLGVDSPTVQNGSTVVLSGLVEDLVVLESYVGT